MLEQPSELKRELCGSYLKMPPYALLLRMKGANIAGPCLYNPEQDKDKDNY
jgi:hypothetical protein